MKCPRCGSGRNRKQRLNFMDRYTCMECSNSWTDQVEAIPDRTTYNPVTEEVKRVRGQDSERRRR